MRQASLAPDLGGKPKVSGLRGTSNMADIVHCPQSPRVVIPRTGRTAAPSTETSGLAKARHNGLSGEREG